MKITSGYITPKIKIVTSKCGGFYAWCMENADYKVLGNSRLECMENWVKCLKDEGVLI